MLSIDEINRLEQENKELKEEVETWKYQAEQSDRLADEDFVTCKKYKQALEEIRGMLEKSMDIKTNSYWHFHYIEKAQEKINEVLK